MVNRNYCTDVATTSLPPGARSKFPDRWSPLLTSTGKNRGGTVGSHGLCCRIAKKTGNLGVGCRNQDLNGGGGRGEEERGEAATITTDCYHGNFPQISVREGAEDLIIT